MDRPHVVITYVVDEKKRTQISSLFETDVALSFLFDIPRHDREHILRQATVLLSWNLSRELTKTEFSLLQKVRLIQLLSAGADQLQYDTVPETIVIASNAGAYAEPIAEHIVGMTLALAKNLLTQHQKMAQGEFNQTILNRFLKNGICGIIGFGGIGRATARLMKAFGMQIYAVNTSGRTDERVEFAGTVKDLRKVLSASDIIVISLPLTRSTVGLIGERELGWMKPDAILINVARGRIINESSLYRHLLTHPEFKTGIDTWWIEPFTDGEFRMNYPFFTLPNVLGSPHNSAMVPGMSEQGTRRAIENVKRFLRGEAINGTVRRDDYLETMPGFDRNVKEA